MAKFYIYNLDEKTIMSSNLTFLSTCSVSQTERRDFIHQGSQISVNCIGSRAESLRANSSSARKVVQWNPDAITLS